MAMDPMDREPNVYNRETNVYDNTGRGSNTLAYVIGGLVVALGLLAFLFYDGGSNEPSTTGSTGTQTESSSPSTGSGATGGSSTAPATPTSPATPAPAAPSAPANPQ
ncbi:LPXTG cell wall anchor domain-containing protein [Microvirga sp. CF3016]|uniref:LPXTG cell wall anchor domain-containing protein n=1 Tax=Microvirga sp. CF3016 TaxID=3110181 RepID=UPI002E7857D9|nr:LPXTG cell wall anchor domain-containing protein [Microvirga sp. CF3016]MEE1610923.1 LPXTG cell wall anchor domain-containing protein [Microvirga sp. CF3016]